MIHGLNKLGYSTENAHHWLLRRDKSNYFDIIRLLLAIAVIYHHSLSIYHVDNLNVVSILTRDQIACGPLAVNCFFTISGFFILYSWSNSKNIWDYLSKRVLRIFPAFVAMTLFCVCFVLPMASPSGWHILQTLNFGTILSGIPELLLNIPNVFPRESLSGMANVAIWTISFEFQCYLLVLIFGIIGLYRRPQWIILFWVGIFLLYALHPNGYAWPRFLTYFLAGAIFYLIRGSIPYSRKIGISCLILIVASILIGHNLLHSILPVFGTYLLFYIGFSTRNLIKTHKVDIDLSYGTYLFACPLQQLLALYFFRPLNYATNFAIAAVGTLFIATLSWYLIERPCLRLKTSSQGDKPLAAEKTSEKTITWNSESILSFIAPFFIIPIGICCALAVSHLYFALKTVRVLELVTHRPMPNFILTVLTILFALWLMYSALAIWNDIQLTSREKRRFSDDPLNITSLKSSEQFWEQIKVSKWYAYLPVCYVLVFYSGNFIVHFLKTIFSAITSK